ncbi:hypothetical protein [Flavihumibacter sp. UBA7668]|uniref:hypothetical protein n=1 Tax=Flavihumibacter sp. UBA7668 TaxID=1946542 RepID=UPI0025C5395F|nr:hypothetical protein [Flavihumibacter sp. UBA7668]
MKWKWMSLLSLLSVAIILISCNKNDEDGPALQNETYQLVNLSSGSSQSAGTFRILEQSNGNAAVEINLAQAFRINGARFNAVIVTYDESTDSELVYANLGEINGGSARVLINPVLQLSTNQAISYADLTGRTGYTLKLLNGANVQASGQIQ